MMLLNTNFINKFSITEVCWAIKMSDNFEGIKRSSHNRGYQMTHWHSAEYLKTDSYSSYDVALKRGVDTGSVDVAAADRDNGVIRYESWKFVFADYVTEGGSEGFDCSVTFASHLACRECCCAPATVPAP